MNKIQTSILKNFLKTGLIFLVFFGSFFLSDVWAASTDATSDATSDAAQNGTQNLTQNPEVLLQKTITSLQKEIDVNKTKLQSNSQTLNQMVTQHLLPIIYVDKMAAMTLGPKWRSASKADRAEFVQQFSLLLTRTYSQALLQMGSYKIVVFPLRGDAWKAASNVAVSGELSPMNGGASSSMTYYMAKEGDSWKIYDFALEGVSFVKNFRAQFNQYPDLKSLLARLEIMNTEAQSKVSKN